MGPTSALNSSQLRQKSWAKDDYLVSTDTALIPMADLMDAFSTFYWAKHVPEDAMQEMLDNSLCFGLYKHGESPTDVTRSTDGGSSSRPKFIGFARLVTDFTTFAYLTDVWVNPVHQGGGLGTWLVHCVLEATEHWPYLRRSVLFTGDWERSVPFYAKTMGMELVETKRGETLALMERKGRGHPMYGTEKKSYD